MDLVALSQLFKLDKDGHEVEDNELDAVSGSTANSITPGQIGPRIPTSAAPPAAAKKGPSKDIWADEEVDAVLVPEDDARPEPEYEVLYRQAVSPEDMYLGMSGRDPSSSSCEDLLVRIRFPDTSVQAIQLDVTDTFLDARSPKLRLGLHLPRKVDGKNGKAQWDKKKATLSVTLRIINDFAFLRG